MMPALVAVLLASCSGGSAPDGTSRTTTDSTAPTTADATTPLGTTPPATGGPAPSGPAPIGVDVDLAPGTYSSTHFRPAVTFTIADPWHAGFDEPTHLDLFMGGPRQLTFLSGIHGTPDKALDRVRSVDGLDAGPVRPATVGDIEGSAFDASLEAGPVLPFSPVGYELHVGDEMRLIAIELGGRTVFVVVQAANGDLPAFVETVEDVLATVSFDTS